MKFRTFIIGALCSLPLPAFALDCGPGTTLGWDYDNPVGTATGFNVYQDSATAPVTTVPEGTLQAVVGVSGLSDGAHSWTVTAYKDVTGGPLESDHSNEVTCNYITGAPPIPLNLNFLP